jgi:hypothetical protein
MLSRMRQVSQVSHVCLMVCLPAALGCGSAAVRECRLSAVEQAVPEDPGKVTVDDVIAVIERLAACKRAGAEAGAPP